MSKLLLNACNEQQPEPGLAKLKNSVIRGEVGKTAHLINGQKFCLVQRLASKIKVFKKSW